MRFLVLFYLVLCISRRQFANGLSSEETNDVAETCCSVGESFAVSATAVQQCNDAEPPDDIEPDQTVACLAGLRGCCEHYFTLKDECAAGFEFAPSRRCSLAKGEVGKNCCEECSIGRWSGESQGKEACGGPADEYDSPTTALRKNAFYKCCVEAANEPTTTEPPPITSRRPETTTKARERCKPKSCDHVCSDEDGKIRCSCRDGYRLLGDRKTCKDINECAEALDDLCTTEGTVCHNTPGSFKCVPIKKRDVAPTCPPGFKRNVQNQVCDDINECQSPRPPCPKYLCENTIGGFKCAGKAGIPYQENAPGPVTVTETQETTVKNDICPPGFRAGPNDECLDIDECAEHLDDCQRLSQHCINTHGNFFCQDHVSKRCAPGFKVNEATGVCEDIDECEESTEVCQRTEVCVNMPGAYTCKSKISTLPRLGTTKTCQEGTRMRPGGTVCEDIDECREGTHLCDQFQNCVNTYGGHECQCKSGFELDSSGSCVDIDECALKLDNCREGQHCLNVVGTFTCTRRPPTTSTPPPVAIEPPYEYEYYDEVDNSTEDNNTDNVLPPTPKTTAPPRTTPPPRTTVPSRTTPPPRTNVPPRTTAPPRTTPQPRTTPPPRTTTTVKPADRPTQPSRTYPTQPSPTRPTVTRPTPASTRPTQPRRPYQPSYPTTTEPTPAPPTLPTRPPYYPRTTTPRQPFTSRPRQVTTTPVPTIRPEAPTRRLESPRRTTTRPNPLEEVTVPSPEDPVTVEKEKDAEGSYNIDTSAIPKDRWTNVIGTERTEPPPPPRENDFDPNELHCLNGYERNDRGECVDINECASSRHICSSLEVCENRPGGYTCNCIPGYRRNSTGWCVEESPPTSPRTTAVTNPATPSTPATARPTRPRDRRPGHRSCEMGYEFDPKTGKCVDIDECSSGRAGCAPAERCVNAAGGYRCECSRCQPPAAAAAADLTPNYVVPPPPPPPRRAPDSAMITVGAQYGQRGPRAQRPSFVARDGSGYASCPWGYKLTADRRCLDIDECAKNISECGPEQRCENFYGGYTCQCPAGHRLVADTQDRCEDIDECRYGQPCPYNSECVNTVGSYRCACGDGFRNAPTNDKVCVDVDECSETPHVCAQGCANAWGGYRCYCQKGYRLGNDNRTCVDVDECAEWARGALRGRLCAGQCVNAAGSYRCECPRGYRLSEDARTCIDIDECENGEATCAHAAPGEVCQNTRGGYHCHRVRCPPGYRLEDRHRCSRIQRSCPISDWECLHQPSSYSYNFITLASNIYLPEGSVALFTMHGPAWVDSAVSFEMRMLDVQASAGVKPLDLSCFDMRPSNNVCVVSLLCSPEGPQVAELELTMSLFQRAQFAGSAVARLVVIVGQYDF